MTDRTRRSHLGADGQRTRIAADLARTAAREGAALKDALDAELWASGLVGAWNAGRAPWLDLDDLLGRPLVAELERIATDGALAALRALAAVASGAIARESHEAAAWLAALGVHDPEWEAELGNDEPVAARRVRDAIFDDGTTVLVEFLRPSGERYTLGVFVDHNLGGMAKDAFVTGPLDEVAATLRNGAESGLHPGELTLPAARARLHDALEATDRALDTPPSVELVALRAFVDSRVRALPDGAVVLNRAEVGDAQRAALLDEFAASPEGSRYAHLPRSLDVVALAIDFAADYVDGRPLRWSPLVIERFMAGWLPSRVAGDWELADRMGEVLPAWVRYAGRRWGAPASAVEEAATAVARLQEGLLAAAEPPWAESPPRQRGRGGMTALAGTGSTPWP